MYDFLRERERDVSLGRYVRKQSHFGTREISELPNRMATSNPIDHPRARVSHGSRYRCLGAISGRWGVPRSGRPAPRLSTAAYSSFNVAHARAA
jgi:hypothetical protein